MSGYAIRQLNPFGGVLQVVETASARAFSDNGVLWHLQVLAARPEHTWRSADRQSQRQLFNWALWSSEKGMHRVNANPLMDLGAMQQAADELLRALQACLPQMPFELADRFEYWCCDKRDKPVALIASRVDAGDAVAAPDPGWHATAPDESGFQSRTLAAAGIVNSDERGPRAHAQRLESELRRHVDSCFWFEREADGSGRRMGKRETLDRAEFPVFGIRTDWREPLLDGLVSDYIAWLSPLLLQLPLAHGQRAELEKLAIRRAEQVADRYRLYPDIVQPQLIEQARVEARLRRS